LHSALPSVGFVSFYNIPTSFVLFFLLCFFIPLLWR